MRRDAAIDEAARLTDTLAILEGGLPPFEKGPLGWGADIPVTVDEDTAWATL